MQKPTGCKKTAVIKGVNDISFSCKAVTTNRL